MLGESNPDFQPLALIAQLMFVAMAFSCQLLPLAIDALFIRKGTQTGAICGINSWYRNGISIYPIPGANIKR